jgi:glycosyltransferase involved in cell wall biosynthesis
LWILGGITWFTWQAVAKVRRHPAILYHANDFDTLPAGVFLSRLRKAPLLYDAHELFWDQFSGTSRQFRAILFALEHRLIRFAHKVVTVNPSIAETLSVRHAVPMPDVVMNCPPAPEPGTTGDGGPSPRGRAARVIYQGIFMRDRGLEELIRSARWYESSELYLRGYGEHEPVLRELVTSEGLQGRVHFLPPADPARMVESLAGFDIGVVPYRATSINNRLCLPNKVFEYLQAGLVLAVSALPELQRVVRETAAGEVFDPDQPRDIARAINALARDAGRLAGLKARARAAGRERFTWEAQGEPRLLACYRELAGSRAGGAEA